MSRAGTPTFHTVTVTRLAQTGEGIAELAPRRHVLVPGTLPGDVVTVRLGRNDALESFEVDTETPGRLVPPCAIVERCGGCAWQHVPADAQRDARLATLRHALPPAAREVPVAYVPAPAPYGYRTRARLAFHTGADGRVTLGFRARGSHALVDVPGCVVLAPALDAALAPLREALALLRSGRGEVALALGAEGAPVAAVRVEALPAVDPRTFALPELLRARGFAGAALWVPGASAPAVEGDPRPQVRGGDGAPLWLAPEGFAQANEALNAQLAAHVAREAQAEGRVVLELYAGAGNFTVLLARAARKVIAVESDAGATAALRANVAARGLEHVTVVEGDAVESAARRADVVVLDPPRTGAREACAAIARGPARRVVYVSCDPPTLGRDLAALAEGFELTALAGFEMFPQTPHLEIVATLERRRGGPGRRT